MSEMLAKDSLTWPDLLLFPCLVNAHEGLGSIYMLFGNKCDAGYTFTTTVTEVPKWDDKASKMVLARFQRKNVAHPLTN